VPVQRLIIISDSNNAIVDEASIQVNDLVYNLGRNEIFGVINDGHTASVITGSSGTYPSVNPTTSSSPSTTTSSPTPISTTSASSTPNSGSSGFGTTNWIITIIVIVLILIIIIFLWYKHQRKNSSPYKAPKKDTSEKGPDNESKTNNVVIQQPQQTQTSTQNAPILTTPPPPPPTQQEPAESLGWRDEKIQQIIQKFQEKGATSPQTAMTAKELGLSRIFVRIMERRKEQTKMFVEINGKYYLDQQALKENKQ
jgi:preprotein translocase subunit SecG